MNYIPPKAITVSGFNDPDLEESLRTPVAALADKMRIINRDDRAPVKLMEAKVNKLALRSN